MSTDIFLPSFDYDTEEEELGGEGLIVPVEHPYGAQYEEITKKRLKEIHYELGLIKLCWPELPTTGLHRCKHLPHSYSHQTNKEKLILWYAENCRRQFHFLHPDRRPQFLAADNECGIQKMVCTTIRPTSVPYPEFSTWQGCAKFVSDHLLYKPLEKPTLLERSETSIKAEDNSGSLSVP
uniref:Uncharacterized protein n=1 Tax=Timema tahoe TaxID=61484 RepID=A0A7R9IF25_9NEOP|nr:unnamed protein product [Timema tahoe]